MIAAPHARRGFTLVEMLAVMGIIILLLAAVVPVITSVMNSRSVTNAAGDISGLLEQARTYAMANNTYVYIGFFEADASLPESTRPQQPPTSPSNGGRVYVGVIATKDGTAGFSGTNNTWPADSTSNNNVSDINKAQRFDGVHLVPEANIRTLINNADTSSAKVHSMDISTGDADISSASGVTFDGPAKNSAATKICTYKEIVQFTPLGRANIITDSSGTHVQLPYIQFGLQAAHGNQVNANNPDCAGVQIDGLTGVVRVFRPNQG